MAYGAAFGQAAGKLGNIPAALENGNCATDGLMKVKSRRGDCSSEEAWADNAGCETEGSCGS